MDTPVEILHTAILGIVETLLDFTIKEHFKNVQQKTVLVERVKNIARINGSYKPRASSLAYFVISLVGKDMKFVVQHGVFLFAAIIPEPLLSLWMSCASLCGLLYMHTIDDWNIFKVNSFIPLTIKKSE
jgi:hypothetical protein